MTLARPVLDNRTYAQLVSESVGQISRLAPAWTNYTASDPGLTLIELVAWLSEQNLYRTDRMTPELTRAILPLVGAGPEPPAIASTRELLTTESARALRREGEAELGAAQRACPPGFAAMLPDWRHHYAASVVWEFHAGVDDWQPLPAVEDEIRALTLTGFVRFEVPTGHVADGPG